MNRFWKIAIGSSLVGTSLVAAGCRKESTASAAPGAESAVGLSAQRLETVAALTEPRTGPHRLKPRHSGKCLGVSGAGQGNHAKLIQWDCTGGDEQSFWLVSQPDGTKWITPAHTPNAKCIGVEQSSSANGADVVQWDCTGGDDQKYTLEGMGEGFWKIHPKHSGKCLGVKESRQDNGAEVIQWDCTDGFDQQFTLND